MPRQHQWVVLQFKTVPMKKNIILQRIGSLGIVALLLFSALTLISSRTKPVSYKKTTGEKIVVMELFTSQGCSSCPPADALLGEYVSGKDSHIIALSFHVDYWNRLGWADPFSKSDYSARQQQYSQHFPQHSVYTPQLVVNGREEVVGNDRKAIKKLVQKELAEKQQENILIEGVVTGRNSVSFHYKAAGNQPGEVLNIALVQKQATTNIKAGENAGVNITNHNIVRSFITQPLTNEGLGLINLPPSFKAADYSLVVYVQNKKNFSINAAAIKEL